MATDRHILSSGGEAESTKQTFGQAVPPAFKIVDSDSDLRRRSLPVRMFPENPAQAADTPRSSSANDGCSRDTLLALSLHAETKAAFEDSQLHLRTCKTSGNEQRLASLCLLKYADRPTVDQGLKRI